MSAHRLPYVGDGADGARRSAEIDRTERDGLGRWQLEEYARLTDSIARWETQARDLEESAAVEASLAREDARWRRIGGRPC